MKNVRGRECTCEETPLDGVFKCGVTASAVVDNGDRRVYYMCSSCTNHNVKNRGAVILQALSREKSLDELNRLDYSLR